MPPNEIGTVMQLLRFNAASNAAGPALISESGSCWTHHQLLAAVESIVMELRNRGLRRNDRIITVLPNGLDAAIGFLSTSGCATAAPLNPNLSSDEFSRHLGDLAPALVLTQQGYDTAIREAASLARIPVLEIPSTEIPWEDTGISEVAREADDPRPDDVGLILHTSGTTSRPKRVPLAQAQLIASSENISRTLELAGFDRCLNVMPLFHIHGLMAGLMASLRAGGSVICASGFDSSRVLDWFATLSPTWYTAVPTIHQALLSVLDERKMERPNPNPLRLVRSSSSAMPLRVIAELEDRLGVPVIEAYGMTEATHQIASNPLPPRSRKPGSVGLPVGVEVSVVDPDGAVLPFGAIGEIALRGPTITVGYEDHPEANTSAFGHGWFRTGDQGRIDEDGYVFLTGRIREMINRGGEKVAPVDVDNALLEHAAVEQAATFAVPHPTLGEDVAAAVVLRPGRRITEGELRTHLMERVADFNVPSRIIFVESIPKGTTGKLQRDGLADRLRDALAVVFAAPATPFEQALAEIWSEVLGEKCIGRDDNFFFLGGDSLSATRVLTRVSLRLGVSFGVRQLFDSPTLKAQAALLSGMVQQEEALNEA